MSRASPEVELSQRERGFLWILLSKDLVLSPQLLLHHSHYAIVLSSLGPLADVDSTTAYVL